MGLEVLIRRKPGKKIRVNPEDADELDLEPGDLVILLDEIADEKCVGKVTFDDEMEEGTVGIDQAYIDTLSSSEDSYVTLDLYEGDLKVVDHIVFGIEPLRGQDPSESLMMAREHENDLLEFMDKRAIIQGQKVIWEEFDVNVEILETKPPLGDAEVAIISREILGGFEYRSTTRGVPFDGVLLIDVSGSMKREDIRVKGLAQVITHLKGGFTSETVQSFLRKFEEGSYVKRYDSAALSALIYLSEKIGRGKGEKIGIVPFTAEASILTFDGQNYFDSSVNSNIGMVAEQIVNAVRVAHSTTNLSDGLLRALQLCSEFGDEKVKMLVILTDGRPTKPDSEERVLSIVNEQIAKRADIIVNAAGIGSKVDSLFLKEIVRRCRGEYIKVTDLKGLVEWYSGLARNLQMKGEVLTPEEVPLKTKKSLLKRVRRKKKVKRHGSVYTRATKGQPEPVIQRDDTASSEETGTVTESGSESETASGVAPEPAVNAEPAAATEPVVETTPAEEVVETTPLDGNEEDVEPEPSV